MLERLQHSHPIDEINPVVTAADVIACQQSIREVQVNDKVRRYLLQIVQASREHGDLHLGGSPRASIGLYRTGQALAAIIAATSSSRRHQEDAHAVLDHRLICGRKAGCAK